MSEPKEKIPAIKEIDQSQRHMNYFKPSMQKPTSSQPQIGGATTVSSQGSLGVGGPQPMVNKVQQQTPQMLAAADYQAKAAREYNNYLKEEVKVSNPMQQQQLVQQKQL